MSPPHDDPNKMRLLSPHSSFPCEPPISILKSKSSSTARSRSSSGTWSPPTHKSWDAKPLRYARKVSFEGDAAAWPGMPSRSPVTPDHTAGFYYPSSSSSATSRGTQGQDAWVAAATPPVPVWRLLEQHPPVGTTTGTTTALQRPAPQRPPPPPPPRIITAHPDGVAASQHTTAQDKNDIVAMMKLWIHPFSSSSTSLASMASTNDDSKSTNSEPPSPAFGEFESLAEDAAPIPSFMLHWGTSMTPPPPPLIPELPSKRYNHHLLALDPLYFDQEVARLSKTPPKLPMRSPTRTSSTSSGSNPCHGL